ncbi:hypothetical protein QBC41DRAFT_107383 [Cercophora samala]|uniref:2EXR domain-containing protein n=1 Tax=Cercophora samala TaxID=330535 RepID=A0AA39ZEG1_9PEZI|nr:hypothetical protein QBC41DRAFT_107383 [Cercophora samala]
MASTTFHPFPRLPYELRALIWEFSALEPRTIEVRVGTKPRYIRPPPFAHELLTHPLFGPLGDLYNDRIYAEVSCLLNTGLTPIPPLMHTCHEARNLMSKSPLGYTQAFATYSAKVVLHQRLAVFRDRKEEERLITPPPPPPGQGRVGRRETKRRRVFRSQWKRWPLGERYIWVNWERDVISVGRDREAFAEVVLPEERLVRKLKFEWDPAYLGEGRFANLGEIHIVCVEGPIQWHRVWGEKFSWDAVGGKGIVTLHDEDIAKDEDLCKALKGRKAVGFLEFEKIYNDPNIWLHTWAR